MTVQEYIDNLNQRYQLGNATEHTFRGDLQQLIESLIPDVRATNEPKRQSCGAPDYILTRKEIPVGFIEAKDIGDNDLEGKKKTGNKEQFDRYKASLQNLIFTDYINFYLYREGEFVTKIAIAEITEIGLKPLPENIKPFENLIKDFCTHIGQTIKSPKRLAEMMAGKARLLSDVIEKALTSDETHNEDSTLKEQMLAFKDILIHDITAKGFADVYAQTIAYGLFAARLHDPTLDTFSRQEAAELIPKSNPFLRKLFGYIAGPDIDDRIKWIVDNLTEIFLACNVEHILKNYGKSTKMEDPIIHFYETFLSEYDPKLRKARGVWYTPAPVVNFIVRAVDDILKTEFDLPQGLADTSKTKITLNTQIPDKRSITGYRQTEEEVHKVQILDPATGTGTFLAEVIKHVHKKFKGQEGIWSSYVENNLIPRLNGFELLMASYAMAHLQLDLLLKETGFKPTINQRTKIYLTNSLEEHHPDTGTLFANWLSSEANEANHIKRDTPVMCVIGNPPYAVSSSNKGDWIQKLLEDYKKGLNEKSYNSLSDDYVKFIRYGQHYVEKNGSGILAYISNNSFIDGLVFRRMRKNLLETFDKIYIIDLHGNTRKKEKTPDGLIDNNVFDIMAGVSINIFIKKETKSKKKSGELFHFDLYGKREAKYDFLNNNEIASIKWNKLKPQKPNYFFIPKDYDLLEKYSQGFRLNDLFIESNAGLATEFDQLAIQNSKKDAENLLAALKEKSSEEIINLYGFDLKKISKVDKAIKDIKTNQSIVTTIDYRPFDLKHTIYTGLSNGIMGRPRHGIMRHLLKPNISLLTCRQQTSFNFQHAFVSKNISERCSVSLQTGEVNYIFPLYLYITQDGLNSNDDNFERIPNFKKEGIEEFSKRIESIFEEEESDSVNTYSPIDIMDYIYSVLYSPSYRKEYNEFLKTDFPRIPYPKDKTTFRQLVQLGKEIREMHLMESSKSGDYETSYPVDGNNRVTRKITKTDIGYEAKDNISGRVWINDQQYFDNVSLIAWEFYIGGYQPAQKWLKDRMGRTLEFDDILHYQKIIVALNETDRLMKEIDKIDIE